MIDNSVSASKIQAQLIADFRQLSSPERDIVQLFSIIYVPVSRSSFMDCLNRTGTKNKNGKTFVTKNMKPILDSLVEKGLLYHEGGHKIRCHPLLEEIATRDAVQEGRFDKFVQGVERKYPVPSFGENHPRYFSCERELVREIRIGVYRQDYDFVLKQMDDYDHYNNSGEKIFLSTILMQIFNNPFDKEWFRQVPKKISEDGLWDILLNSAVACRPAHEAFSFLREICADPDKAGSDVLNILLAEQFILRGRLGEAEQVLARMPSDFEKVVLPFQGWVAFLKGDTDQAVSYFTAGLKAYKKKGKKAKGLFQRYQRHILHPRATGNRVSGKASGSAQIC